MHRRHCRQQPGGLRRTDLWVAPSRSGGSTRGLLDRFHHHLFLFERCSSASAPHVRGLLACARGMCARTRRVREQRGVRRLRAGHERPHISTPYRESAPLDPTNIRSRKFDFHACNVASCALRNTSTFSRQRYLIRGCRKAGGCRTLRIVTCSGNDVFWGVAYLSISGPLNRFRPRQGSRKTRCFAHNRSHA